MRTDGSSLRHDPVSMSQARRAFAAQPLAALLATGFGAGLSPVAPGTAGSLLGLAAAWSLASHASILGSPVGLLMSGLAVGLVGVAVSGPVGRALESEDPGCIVIDEIAGQFIACAGAALVRGAPVWAWVASFALFRFFDVVKPLGIRKLQELPGGWGVVADDVLAGLYAAALLALASRWA
jgi:phosphatidylglycerophosphatase A